MKKLQLFRLLFAAMLVTASTAFMGCSDDDDEVKTPTLEVSPQSLQFDENGGAKTFDIVSTGFWKITGTEGQDWFAVTPALSGTGNQTITITTDKDNVAHSADIKVTVYMDVFGVQKEVDSKTVKITQTPGGDIPSDEVIYGNNFDKERAVQVDGRWPYLDQTEAWKNAEGTGISTVTYASESASVRTSGKLSGGYENASGVNKIFFGSLPASFTIQDITLPADKLNFRLEFGGAYSLKTGDVYDNIFKPESFLVTLGDGTEWSGSVTYEKIGGDDTKDPFWVLYAANFTLDKPVEKLSVKFEAKVGSAFAIDDVKLTEGVGGQLITFNGETPGTDVAITIPEIIAKLTTTQTVLDATNNRVFEAVVVTDVDGGNVNENNLQVMTPGATTSKNGITLYGSGKFTNPRDAAFTFKKGDKVKVTLMANKARIVNYQGLYEITGSVGDEWVSIEKTGTATITPLEASVAQLADYQGMVVKLNDAKSPAAAAVWCEADKFGQHIFTVGGSNVTVFVQANMPGLVGQDFVANATGSVTGYATVYQNNAQICPQIPADVAAFMSSTPAITTVTPDKLNFGLEGGTQTVAVTTANTEGGGYEIKAALAAADAGITVTVAGNVITVVAAASASEKTNTLNITLEKAGVVADTKTVPIVQKATQAAGFESMSLFTFAYANNNSADAYYTLATQAGANSTVNGETATGIKFGTGSKAGVYTTAAVGVTGNKTLTLYGLAWKGKSATLYVRVNGGGSINGASSVALTANDGVTGNPAFTITGVTGDNLYTFNLENLTAASTITISTNEGFTAAADANTGRAVIFGVQLQ